MEKETVIPLPKQRILDWSFIAFNARGFQAVSMDAVAKELKISKKTIYKYFGSKEELLEAALVNLFGQVEARLTQLQRQKAQKNQIVAFFEILKTWRLAVSTNLRTELGQELPYLHDRIETFERQNLLRYMIGYLKDLRTDEVIDYPSPSREFAVSFFHLMGSIVPSNEEQAHFFLTSLMRGMAVKNKKKGK